MVPIVREIGAKDRGIRAIELDINKETIGQIFQEVLVKEKISAKCKIRSDKPQSFLNTFSLVMSHGCVGTILRRTAKTCSGLENYHQNPKQFRLQKSRIKTFFDIHGVIHAEFVLKGKQQIAYSKLHFSEQFREKSSWFNF